MDSYVKNGTRYYRLVEGKRVDGKPRPVPVLHLGTAAQILDKLTQSPAGLLRIASCEHGPVAALKRLADRIELAAIIDRHVPETAHGLSVGTTLELAILGRAIHPTSKRAWHTWAEQTSIDHMYPGLDPEKITSQYFWDQMNLVPEDALERIETELAQRVIEDQDVELDTLFYDATNFFTFIDTTNTRNKIAQRGKNKQHRNDLRQVSLALLVTRDGRFPLASHVYEGNRADATEFPHALSLIRQRLTQLVGSVQDITLVYDRGNNSKTNQALVDELDLHYVAALSPSQHEAFIPALPEHDHDAVATLDDPFKDQRAVRWKSELWGAERTFVAYRSDKLQKGQTRGLRQHVEKAVTALVEWKEKLANPRAGPRSQANADKQVKAILMAQHLSKVLDVVYDIEATGTDRLDWHIDTEDMERLERDVFGLRLLMTDQHDWTSEEIIQAYHGQAEVEGAFRSFKSVEHVRLRPQFHWTDQKIRVHVFLCLAAYLLNQVLAREARAAGFEASTRAVHDLLGQVRLATVVQKSGPEGGRPRVELVLETVDTRVQELFRSFVPVDADPAGSCIRFLAE